MQSAIAILQSIGSNAGLRYAAAGEANFGAPGESLDPRHDHNLAAILGVPEIRCCVMFPVKEDDKPDDKEPDRDDEQEIRRVASDACYV
ncbi:MAG: hypothetical protein JSS44_11430 [Proteobacteria bacterium]|nr:hypothetical protein [Pseudomonadota bacterium]MBS0465014.1 hypothetical protein [Pseudomonadota bacterium]